LDTHNKRLSTGVQRWSLVKRYTVCGLSLLAFLFPVAVAVTVDVVPAVAVQPPLLANAVWSDTLLEHRWILTTTSFDGCPTMVSSQEIHSMWAFLVSVPLSRCRRRRRYR